MLFLCRHRDCGLIAEGRFWVRKAGGQQFRCPACGTLWRPWQVGPNLLPASHAVPVSIQEDGTSNVMLLQSWEPSFMFDAFDSARFAGRIPQPAELERNIIRVRFVAMTLQPDMRTYFDQLNHSSRSRSWLFNHLEGGFIGAHLHWQDIYTDMIIAREAVPFVAVVAFRAALSAGARPVPQGS